ncbi:hypothetical protein ACQPZJ_15665 [Actinoplanes sp. CA-054009]
MTLVSSVPAAARTRLVATLGLLVAVAGFSWWVFRPDPPADPDRIIAAAHRATGKAGVPRQTDHRIFEIADDVCSTLRQKQSLIAAQSLATRQLRSTPKHGLEFVFATIDNRCRDADDEGLIDNDEGKLNKNYR